MRLPLCAILAVLALPCQAQDPQPAVKLLPAEAVLMKPDETSQDIWIINATKTAIRYLEAPNDTSYLDITLANAKSLYIKEPLAYTQAMDLMQSRKYAEARAKFATIKESYRYMDSLPGNYSTLAAFHEMECMRKAGDLTALVAAAKKFIPASLQREYHRQQVELYTLWEAAHEKSWQRLEALAREQSAVHLPASLRAQVGYCLGLACEGLKKYDDALMGYSHAMVADSGASEDLARPAAINSLRIYKNDPEVRKAIAAWGLPEEIKTSNARTRLLDASALAHVYQNYLAQGAPLPPELQDLLKYKTAEEKATKQPSTEPAK